MPLQTRHAVLQSKGRSEWMVELSFNKRRTERMIGRAPGCSLVLTDPHISSRHVRFRAGTAADGVTPCVVVEDSSTNGTWLNGNQLTKGVPVPMEDGCELKLPCDEALAADHTFVLTVPPAVDGTATYPGANPSALFGLGAQDGSATGVAITGAAVDDQAWAEVDALHDKVVAEAARLAACIYVTHDSVQELLAATLLGPGLSSLGGGGGGAQSASASGSANGGCAKVDGFGTMKKLAPTATTKKPAPTATLQKQAAAGDNDDEEVERLRAVSRGMLAAMRAAAAALRDSPDPAAALAALRLEDFEAALGGDGGV